MDALQKYTTELGNRENESAKVIQNGIDHVMETKKLVARDLQSYAKEFDDSYMLRTNCTYCRANY